jgi:hypothetical protein
MFLATYRRADRCATQPADNGALRFLIAGELLAADCA